MLRTAPWKRTRPSMPSERARAWSRSSSGPVPAISSSTSRPSVASTFNGVQHEGDPFHRAEPGGDAELHRTRRVALRDRRRGLQARAQRITAYVDVASVVPPQTKHALRGMRIRDRRADASKVILPLALAARLPRGTRAPNGCTDEAEHVERECHLAAAVPDHQHIRASTAKRAAEVPATNDLRTRRQRDTPEIFGAHSGGQCGREVGGEIRMGTALWIQPRLRPLRMNRARAAHELGEVNSRSPPCSRPLRGASTRARAHLIGAESAFTVVASTRKIVLWQAGTPMVVGWWAV